MIQFFLPHYFQQDQIIIKNFYTTTHQLISVNSPFSQEQYQSGIISLQELYNVNHLTLLISTCMSHNCMLHTNLVGFTDHNYNNHNNNIFLDYFWEHVFVKRLTSLLGYSNFVSVLILFSSVFSPTPIIYFFWPKNFITTSLNLKNITPRNIWAIYMISYDRKFWQKENLTISHFFSIDKLFIIHLFALQHTYNKICTYNYIQ